jgi:hypothetical protein
MIGTILKENMITIQVSDWFSIISSERHRKNASRFLHIRGKYITKSNPFAIKFSFTRIQIYYKSL